MLRSYHDILSNPVANAEEEAAGFPTTGHVHFLIEGYEPLYYWFEVLDCVRRLLLAAIIGVVSFTATAAPVAGFAEAFLPRHWVAGYHPSLPLWQVALHEAPLQHRGLTEEQVPPG